MTRNLKKRFRQPGLIILGVAALLNGGCSLDDMLGTDKLPPNLTDPAITHTPQGARAVFNGALAAFRAAWAGQEFPGGGQARSSVIAVSGLLSDELHADGRGVPEDMHFLPANPTNTTASAGTYSRLQRTRGQAGQAIALLQRYDPENTTAIAHAYAIQGYTEVALAELFCSGIPLSTLDFEGDFTYKPGSTTEEVLERAVAHFDTALVLAGDSARVANLARLGRARALLGLGRFPEAAASVEDVPDDYAYRVTYTGGTLPSQRAFTTVQQGSSSPWSLMVADQKGINGLDYLTSGDPRTVSTSLGSTSTSPSGRTDMFFYHPNKYPTTGAGSFVIASGIEARLIEAEAALREGDPSWLQILNHLRSTAYTTIVPAVTQPLPDLADPGTDETRVDMLFRERAFWLFLTGQRQGDMRRLVRHYGRPVSSVYPIGEMPGGGGFSYGGDIDAPIPPAEALSNPLFTGCITRGN